MTQQQLDRAVARATGEDVRAVRRLGFSIADPAETLYDPEPYDLSPQVVDWDELDQERNVPVCPPRVSSYAAA